MKHSLYALATALTAITVGCQETDLSGPAGNPALETGRLAKAATNSKSNILMLGATTGGDGMNGEYSVTGQVRFGLMQRPIMNRDVYDVVLDTQAKVTQSGPAEGVWTVNNVGSEPVDLTNRAVGTLDRWYFLQGGPHSASLHIRFEVTATTVSVASVSVE